MALAGKSRASPYGQKCNKGPGSCCRVVLAAMSFYMSMYLLLIIKINLLYGKSSEI